MKTVQNPLHKHNKIIKSNRTGNRCKINAKKVVQIIFRPLSPCAVHFLGCLSFSPSLPLHLCLCFFLSVSLMFLLTYGSAPLATQELLLAS